MTSLVSFSNLVDGAALSETFESYNPYTGKPWARIPRFKASDDSRESGHSSVDAYRPGPSGSLRLARRPIRSSR
jgi:hypothetical protein